VYARILRPPAHGAKLKNVDTSGVEKMSGARVVRDGDFIAVIYDRPDMADKALALIKAEFDRPQTGLDDKSIFDHIVKNAQPPKVVAESGTVAGFPCTMVRTGAGAIFTAGPCGPNSSCAEAQADIIKSALARIIFMGSSTPDHPGFRLPQVQPRS